MLMLGNQEDKTGEARFLFGEYQTLDPDGGDIRADLAGDLSEHFERFACVYNMGTIEHIWDCHRAWSNAARMTKVGGYLVSHSPVGGFQNHGIHVTTDRYILDFLRLNGFLIVDDWLTTSEGEPVNTVNRDGRDVCLWLVAQKTQSVGYFTAPQQVYEGGEVKGVLHRPKSALNVVCVNWHDYQGCGVEYVNRLYGMISRNLFGVEGKFTVFTDDIEAKGYRPEIFVEPLPRGVTGWWNKLYLFCPGLFRHGERVLYFDLDTVIIGALDEIAAYDGDFAMLSDFLRPGKLQASVMAWRVGFGAYLWQEWNRAGRPEIDHGGDQSWIENTLREPAVLLQELFPAKFVSYKKDCIPFPPEGSSVVVFHGEPRPHNCGRPWVEAMWSEDDRAHFQLAMTGNVSLETIRANIAYSAKLELPELRVDEKRPAKEGRVAIVGGGPSLSDPITLASLARLHAAGGAIWALNGAYDWLRDRGIVPAAHIVIDARMENVHFLQNSRAETTYYIGSQCHASVFDTLRYRNVYRIDMDSWGDCGTTVGTHAILIAFSAGYRDIHLFGYDSSYRNDEGHAYLQKVPGSDRIVDCHIGDRVFKAEPWMVRQAQDFEGIARDVMRSGGTLTVHGDGLLPYLAKLLMDKPVRAAVVRANAVLRRLPEGPVSGVEVGVFEGEMSAALLQRADLSLDMVDSWAANGASYVADSGDWHAAQSEEQQDAFFQQAKISTEFARERARMRRRPSTAAALASPAHRYDFVFIDADHSYEGCKADIEAWVPKLKPDGLLCGHDYENPDCPQFGVKRAVDEFAARHGYTVELGENLTWFIRLGEKNVQQA